MDWLIALTFAIWFEVLGLPLRFLLVRSPMPSSVRRVLSRLAGPMVLIFPAWWIGHLISLNAAMALSGAASLTAAVGAWITARRCGTSATQLLGYAPRQHGSGWSRWRDELGLEILTLALFLGFVAFRRWVPEMTFQVSASAAEKFGNAMIYNACLNAPRLPPEDYWFAGHSLTYYYFGHFYWAVVARTGAWWGLPATLTLNLALARLTVAVFESTWLLARAAGARGAWAIAAGLGAAWAGNPASAIQAWNQWSAGRAAGYAFDVGSFSFWDASRAIKNVVDEFPAFTAILGDFHAHHLALPWFLTWLAIGVGGKRWLTAQSFPVANALLAVSWIVLGVGSVIANFWYLPLVLVAAPLLIIHFILSRRSVAFSFFLAPAFGLALVISIKLQRGPEPVPLQPGNIDLPMLSHLPLRWVPPELRSTPYELFTMWGFPALLFLFVPMICLCRAKNPLNPHWALLSLGISLFILGILNKLPGGTAWVWFGAACLLIACIPLRSSPISLRAVALGVTTCCMLAGLEIVYVPDRFTGALARYNSYFKFSYAAWPILWVVAAFLIRRLWLLRSPPARWALRTLLLLAVPCCAIYTALAIPARVEQAARGDIFQRRPTLDAYAFIANRSGYAEEAPLLAYIREHVPATNRVIEAALPVPYDYGGRIASLAAHPVPIGWDHHEQQWRGEPAFAPLAVRRAEIDVFYRAPSPQAMLAAARNLGAHWAVYGKLEADRYGPPALAMLRRAGQPVAGFPREHPRYFLFAFPEGN